MSSSPISESQPPFFSPDRRVAEKSHQEEKVEDVAKNQFCRKRPLETSLSLQESPFKRGRLEISEQDLGVLPDGGIYEGERKDRRSHGKGKVSYANGNYYKGEFKDGQFDGHGKAYLNGAWYEGIWKQGKLNGFGHKIGKQFSYKGFWKDGKPDGFGVGINKTGERCYTYWGNWKEGKRHGFIIGRYPDGSTSMGQWENDKPLFDEKEARKASLPKNSDV